MGEGTLVRFTVNCDTNSAVKVTCSGPISGNADVVPKIWAVPSEDMTVHPNGTVDIIVRPRQDTVFDGRFLVRLFIDEQESPVSPFEFVTDPSEPLGFRWLRSTQGAEVSSESATTQGVQQQTRGLEELQRRFGSQVQLVGGDRKLVRVGQLEKYTRHRRKRLKYTFHLFNDLLLYSEQQVNGNFKLHRAIPLATTLVREMDVGADDATASQLSADDRACCFEVLSREKSFVVRCRNRNQKQVWLRDIHQCALACRPLVMDDDEVDVAPVWQADKDSTHCPMCQSKFTLVRRRHHCRRCGVLCCGKCSSRRALLVNIDAEKPVRVCDSCADAV
ncbi:MAG: hypothetical protein MHM6MM_001371 [Cercozoa sp. M6MM]